MVSRSVGGALIASTTACTPARAASRPWPVDRSTPFERLIATTSCPAPFRAATTRAPMFPVAPATAIRMMSPVPCDHLSRTIWVRNICNKVRVVKLPVATEWALHCATSLAQLEPGATASAADLAEYFDLPAAYLSKQLQALTRAGVLTATTGPRGGFRLGRAPADITLLHIVEAVDGAAPPYECREIRRQGRGALPHELVPPRVHPRGENG